MRIANPFLTCAVELPDNLKHLPLRRVKVYGEEVIVPTYIIRIESKDNTTMGWQVRYITPSKYIGDKGVWWRDSLEQAVEYLSSIYKG